jgi:hypothetical protein
MGKASAPEQWWVSHTGWWLAPAYALTACVLSLPAVFHLSSAVIGTGTDPWQVIWNIWWVKGWLLGQHALYFTHFLFYPRGANLAWMTLALPAAIVAAGLAAVGLPLTVAYNLVMLASLTADGLAAYWCARKMGLGRPGAVASGFVYMTSPYFMGQMLGHLHLVGAYGIPLVLGWFWDMWRRDRPAWWRYVVLGALLALTTYAVEDYALYTFLLCVLVVLVHPARRGQRLRALLGRSGGWVLALGVYVFLVFPLVDALIVGPLAVHGAAAEPLVLPWVVDALAWVTPDPWGYFHWLSPVWHLDPNVADGSGFPGFVGWAVVVYSAIGRRHLSLDKRAMFGALAILAAIFAVLSMGPVLHVDGHLYRIPMPELYLQILPFWQDTLPERLAAVTALLMGLLVGMTFDALWDDVRTPLIRRAVLGIFVGVIVLWAFATVKVLPLPYAGTSALVLLLASFMTLAALRRRKVAGGRFMLAATLVALVLLGSWPFPYPEAPVPAVPYAATVRQAGGSVFYIPAVIPDTWWGDGDCAYMYLATVFALPSPEGYVSRLPYSTLHRVDGSPVLGYLWGVQYRPNPEARLQRSASEVIDGYFRRHGVRSVVVETKLLAAPHHTLAWLTRALGSGWRRERISGSITLFVRDAPPERAKGSGYGA